MDQEQDDELSMDQIAHNIAADYMETLADEENDVDEEDMESIRIEMNKGCGCQRRCYGQMEEMEVYDHRMKMKELERSEKDMLLLGKLEAICHSGETRRHADRKRETYKYTIRGRPCCCQAFSFFHDVSPKLLDNLQAHVKKNGAVPRVHGNHGRLPPNTSSYDTVIKAAHFISTYAHDNGLADPSSVDVYLPADSSKRSVHDNYYEACVVENINYMRYRSFVNLWNSCMPHIKFMSIKTDMCSNCTKLKESIKSAVDEMEKEEIVTKFHHHIQIAKAKRELYHDSVSKSKEEFATYMPADAESLPLPPCSADLNFQHYTFDYAQPVFIPHFVAQPSQLYFKSLMKVQIYGICSDSTGVQQNYIFDENSTIGPDGTSSHGPDTVISLLHYHLDHFSSGEKGAVFHADNCPGQNKNKTVIHYLLWRIANNLNEDLALHFMEPGHTKCRCDQLFGLGKKLIRKSDINTVYQLGETISRSSKYNEVVQIRDPDGQQVVPWYQWAATFKQYLKPLSGISKYSLFKVTKEDPGVVYCLSPEDGLALMKVNLLKKGVTFDQLNGLHPPEVCSSGLSQARLQYLDSEVRPEVKEPWRRDFCPLPSED